MGFLDRFRGRAPGPGKTPVHVSDPRFEGWETVREFGDVGSARAWHQTLSEAGIEAVLTSDWELDRFGRGEIWLCVRPEDWSGAEEILSGLDLD